MTGIVHAAGGGPVISELTGLTLGSISGPSHTLSADTGGPDSNKHVLAIAHFAGVDIGSATIDGVSASILRQDVWDPGTNNLRVAIFGAKITSPNATLNIGVVGNAGNIQISNIGVYRVRNLLSLTPVAVDGGATATSGDVVGLTKNVDVLQGGLVLAGVKGFNTNAASWVSGVTGDYGPTGAIGVAGGSHHVTADETARAVRYERSSLAIYFAMSVVSLR